MNEVQSTLLDLRQVETPTINQSREDRGTFMICGSCKKQISLEPGDLIYGGQWYHLACSGVVKEPEHDEEMSIQDRLLQEHRAQLKL
jgi:hypothetical protein